MSNGHTVDVEQAFDNLTHATALGAAQGELTLYAVICWNDDVSSHGGFVVANAKEALETAQAANDQSPEGHKCKYIPVAIGMTAEVAEQGLIDLMQARGLDPRDFGFDV